MPPRPQPGPDGVVRNPSWFPASIDGFSGRVRFVRTDRRTLSSLSFLDGREPLSRQGGGGVEYSLDDLASAFQKSRCEISRPWNFIFHTGFCCSTLLARCVDRKGFCLALKEPGVINDLAEAKRREYPLWQDRERRELALGLALELLARPLSGHEQVVIKPSNAANALLPEIIALEPASKLVLLRPTLKEFLIAVAKGGPPRRRFVRQLLGARLNGAKTDLVMWLPPRNQLSHLNDLQIAAVLWAFQVREFESFTKKFPNTHVMSMECGTLLKNLPRATARAADFFGLPPEGKRQMRKRLAGVMSRHAKGPAFSYGPEVRRSELRAIEKYLGKTLDQTLAWAKHNLRDRGGLSALKIAI